MNLLSVLLIFLLPCLIFAQTPPEAKQRQISIVEPEMYAPPEFAIVPERSIDDIFPNAPSEMAVRLKNVKALKIDIPLAKKDYPFMREWSKEKIFRWFERMAGLVSQEQVKQETVNTKIETTGELVKVYRPPGYGRAIVVEFEEEGVKYAFEVKMSGVGPGHKPHHGPHGNGLGTLGEVIREDQFENAERAAIAHAKINGSGKLALGGTVAGYGVLYAGYDVRHADGSTSPAGIYIRQAHRRMNYSEDVRAAWLPGEVKDAIIRQISKYGFYTGWESNIQGLIKNNRVYIFDFGHWIGWQGHVPESGVWVDPKVAIDFNDWGWAPDRGPRRDRDQWSTSKEDKAWIYAHNTANSAKDPMGQSYLIGHYNTMVSRLLKRLGVGVAPESPRSCKAVFDL